MLLSGVFFFWPTINIALFVMVFRRYREILNSPTAESRSDPAPLRDDSVPPPPPYTPGTYVPRQMSHDIDQAPITGWSRQPLLNFDRGEALLNP
ncbi:uncharacterized protein CEXT_564601 [Caerostris extrusa]|uniref:Uncharacterized protein n=1 Tax=Caerostris extrusa TaxID=172846 RepID=A0AAV4STQ2_CAEEX|nr:uncharacterized protein CEXT_564601 [Caerostris extrusa]